MSWAVRFVCILAYIVGSTASAQQVTDCNAALVEATSKSTGSVREDARLSLLVDQKSWSQARSSRGANARLFSLRIGESHQDYQKRAEQFRAEQRQSYTKEEVYSFAMRGLDPEAGKAYRNCLETIVMTGDGLRAAIVSVEENSISILVKWMVPGNPAPAIVEWTPPSVGEKVMPTTISQGHTTIIVPRPTEQIVISGNFKGYTTGPIVLTKLLPPSDVVPWEKRLEKPITETLLFGDYKILRPSSEAGCKPITREPAVRLENTVLVGINECGQRSRIKFRGTTITFQDWMNLAAEVRRNAQDGAIEIHGADGNSWVNGPDKLR